MEKYKRITLYFKMDDNQDSLRYALIGSLGKGKKTIFDNMIDLYLQSYGISNLEDLTLKDLQQIKKELMGTKEEKEKRGRGRPRKIQEHVDVNRVNQANNEEKTIEEGQPQINDELTVSEETPKTLAIEDSKDLKHSVENNKEKVIVKPKSPMSIDIEEDMDDSEDADLDPALLGELGAFF